jgi:RimJ/RimL family protein N-acetyltransferase
MTRALKSSDYQDFSQLRTLGLATDPSSFWASEDEELPIRETRFEATINHKDNFILGVFVENRLVSILGFMREEKVKLSHKGYIWGVFTHPDFRGKGYGKSIMKMAIKNAFTINGVEQVNLSVGSFNKAAKELYLKMGFEIYGEETNASKINGEYNDELYLVKTNG